MPLSICCACPPNRGYERPCCVSARALNVSCCLLQNPQSTLFTIDRHSGVVRIKAGEMLDYEKTKAHFVTVIVRVTSSCVLE